VLVVVDCRARAVVPGAARVALVHAEVEIVGVLLALSGRARSAGLAGRGARARARGASEGARRGVAQAGHVDEGVGVIQPERETHGRG